MLVLNRRPANDGFRDESEIVCTIPPSSVPTEVRFQCLEVRESKTIRIGVKAPKDVRIMRPDAKVQHAAPVG